LVTRLGLLIIFCVISATSAWSAVNGTLVPNVDTSAEGDAPLNFQDWKTQQIREAQEALERANGVKRKAPAVATKGSAKTVAATELPSTQRIHVNDGVESGPQSREVRAAQETLQYAHDLGVEEYITVYLVQFKEDVRALALLMQKLSPQESAQLIQVLMREKERRSEAGVVTLPPPVISQLQGVGGLIPTGAQRKPIKN